MGKLKNIKCRFCTERFDQVNFLAEHCLSLHEGKKLYHCAICNATFLENSDLIFHLGSVHEDISDFKSKELCQNHLETFFENIETSENTETQENFEFSKIHEMPKYSEPPK